MALLGTLIACTMTICVVGCTADGPDAAAPSPTATVAISPVPNVVGMSVTEAAAALTAAGFVSTLSGEGSLVAEQSPAAGTEKRAGYAILLKRGPNADEQAAADAAAAAKEAAEVAAQAAADAAAAALVAAENETEVCAPLRATLADPDFSSTNLAYHAVKDQNVYLSYDAGLKPLPDVVAACPEFAALFADMAAKISSGQVFDDGTYAVGTDVPAGTYVTAGTGITDCYWARTTSGGDIIDNNFIGFAPGGVTISIRAGEGLEVSNCGLWVQQ